jgi:PleD family two-component response regulator
MSKRVLILDDDRAQVPGLKGWFARFQHGYDYDVVAAATASETVTALTHGRPDLIIVEPETDGFAYIPKPVDYIPLEHLVAMACRPT